MANELDSLFEQYAKEAEIEAKASKSSGYAPKEYDEIKYCGLKTGEPTVVRAIGGPPDSDVDEFTARKVTIARIVGDNGKKFRVVRPSIEMDPKYILNRIILRVKQPKYVNGEKTYPVKDEFPEIFNIIEKNGIKKGDIKATYDKGWQGKELLVMNVIDRSQMDWHKQNKHTMLLAKNIGEYEGRDYIDPLDEGISFYSVKPKITQLFKYYGSWEKYDIAITKTGNKDNAFNITNASKNPETVEGEAANFISMEPNLTAEEKSWEKYNISKIYRVTSSTKIYNRLKGTIARIDAVLNTNFLKELEEEVKAEKELFDELYGKNEDGGNTEETATKEVAKPIETVEETVTESTVAKPRARVSTSTANTAEAWRKLPYGDTLSDELKAKVKSVEKQPNGQYKIEWDNSVLEDLAACLNESCEAVAPLSCTHCPACGMDFNLE